MKQKIEEINSSIREERALLKKKAEESLNAIMSNRTKNYETNKSVTSKEEKVPPISYIMYGVGGLSGLSLFASDYKLLSLAGLVGGVFLGYKFSKNKVQNGGASSQGSTASVDLASLKNEATSKVSDSIKKIVKEWEDFMESKQKEVRSAISNSSLNSAQKDSAVSKVYFYEVIDIEMLDFLTMMNTVSNAQDIKNKVSEYKVKLLSAIDKAVDKQIEKYNSL